MELRQLRYFLALAEDLHFTRAAQRVHVAQPALSAQIRALEHEVGGPLVHRTTRQVTLTAAGEALVAEAASLVDEADRTLAEIRSIVRRERQILAVGCLGAPGDLLDTTVNALARRFPEVTVDLRTFDYVQIWSSLVDGGVDLALAYLPSDGIELRDLEVLEICDEPRMVVLSASHKLADRRELRPADLANEVFITHPDIAPERWRDFWLLTDQVGRRPAVYEVRAETVEQWLYLVRRGAGVDTCPAHMARYYGWPTLRFIPLRDAPPTKLSVLQLKRENTPLAAAFLEAVQTAAASHPRVSV